MAGRNKGPSSPNIPGADNTSVFNLISNAVIAKTEDNLAPEDAEILSQPAPKKPPSSISPAQIKNNNVSECGTFDLLCKASSSVKSGFSGISELLSSFLVKLVIIIVVTFVGFIFIRSFVSKKASQLAS